MIIGTIEALVGSIWFGCMMGLIGYFAGNVFPIKSIINIFKKD